MVYRINDNEIYARIPVDSWKKSPKSIERIFDVKMPTLTKESKVMTLGSCFAENIVNALRERNLNVKGPGDFIFYDDMITTTLALKEHFEWCCEEDSLHEPTQCLEYPGTVSSGKGQSNLDSQSIETAKSFSLQSVKSADAVILTFGLSEIWTEETGRSIWKWPGKEKSKELTFSVLSAQENFENIKKIIDHIRSQNQQCAIIMTLSPVPLYATFRKDMNINLANCSSKTNIRSGIDQYLQQNADDKVYYWPSYEFVTQTDGAWQEDERHVSPEVVRQIVNKFMEKTGIDTQ